VDSSAWSKLLHPVHRRTQRCRPSEDGFDASTGNTRAANQDEEDKGQLQAMEEGICCLHITEDRPALTELLHEHVGKDAVRVKPQPESVTAYWIEEMEKEFQVIKEGRLANFYLHPADEDPLIAAVIPRPDGANGGDAVFRRGEPVRTSAGGVIGGKSRPRTASGNAGHLSPDDVTVPSRRGFERTPVRRRSKSPTAAPVCRLVPPSDGILKTGNSNNVSLEVCFKFQ
jgi:hypothetical protein